MKSTTYPCDPVRLERLLDGSLSEHDEADLVRHLDTCPRCQAAIEGLAAESRLWGDARRLRDLQGPAPRPEATQRLGPWDGDSMPTAEDLALEILDPSDRPGVLGFLGPYEVRKVIGRGGMGMVLQAFDPALHRLVAIKVLAPELATSANARRRFAREAQAAAAIAHEHVIPIHAVEPNARLPYLVMHLVPGRSLQDRLDQEGPLETRAILRIGMQTALALAAAHAQGLVHRDIKPANILLENGVERVKITDFGLARAIDDASLTQSGIVAGTPQYMSPEQARGEAIDHRADLFSLGSVLYAMCTGRSPFRAETTLAVLRRVSDDVPRPILEINPEIPDWLAAIIAKLHAKAPEWRFQSAVEVADLLGRCLAYVENPAEKAPPFAKAPRPTPGRSTPRQAIAVAALVALAMGLGVAKASGIARPSELAATVLRFVKNQSVVVVKVEDPQVKVKLDGNEVVITGAGLHEIRVSPGQHELQAAMPGGPEKREPITIHRGEKRVVELDFEPRPAQAAASPPPAVLDFVEDPRLIEAEEALRATEATLMELKRKSRRFDSDPVARIHARRLQILTDRVARMKGQQRPADQASATLPQSQPSGSPPRDRSDRHEDPGQYTPTAPLAASAPPPSSSQDFVTAFEVAPSGRVMLGIGPDAHRIVFEDISLRPRSTLRGPAERRLWALAFSPDGKVLATGAGVPVPNAPSFGDERGELTLWDAGPGQLRLALGQPNVVRSLAFSPDGKVLATVGFGADILLRDAVTGQVIRTLKGSERGVNAVVFAPDGETLATAGLDSAAKVWDVASGEERASLDGASGDVYHLAFSPDGKTLLVGGADATARLWDLSSKAVKFTLRGHDDAIESVAFSPDGKTLATASWDRTVKLWDPSTGKNIATFGGHAWPVLTVAFSPDGKTVAAGGGSWGGMQNDDGPGELRLWDVANGTLRISIPGHPARVFSVAFSPDGKTLASACWDAAVRLWDVEALNRAASTQPPAGHPSAPKPGRPFDPFRPLPAPTVPGPGPATGMAPPAPGLPAPALAPGTALPRLAPMPPRPSAGAVPMAVDPSSE